MGVDPNLSEQEFTKQAYQKYLKAYLRCVKGVDDNVGRLLAWLEASGNDKNTIVIYTSDQGMMLGEHDYIDKRWIFDESIQMPFIVRSPKAKAKANGLQSDMIINNTDFAPLILDLAGIPVPSFMQGYSFADALDGIAIPNWRTATYYRYWTHRAYHDVPAHLGIRSKEFKLVLYYGENFMTEPSPYYDKKWLHKKGKANNSISTPVAWELYDLTKDPQELNNVYGKEEYKDIANKLKEELRIQRKRYNETDTNFPHLAKIIEDNWHN